MRLPPILAPTLAAAVLAACSGGPVVPEQARYGADPQLPAPHKSLLPMVKIAEVRGWPEGSRPTAAPGLAVAAFATGLDHPRRPYVLPNGDVLVAESDAPAKEAKGLRGFIMKQLMKSAGSNKGSPNRIVLLRDADGDGRAETRSVFLSGLNSPFGMVLVGDSFYVANTDAVVRYPYVEGETRIAAPGRKLADLPAGPINHHWTKDMTASPDGLVLYVTVGSNSNAGENGLDKEANRAAVLAVDRLTGRTRLFASGLRNPNGPAIHPDTGQLWIVANERDELGDDLVPDYLTSVREGGFYGWPYSYWGQHVDARVKPQQPDRVKAALRPDYALGSHTANLGLVFYEGALLDPRYRGGAFIGQHGSWNRSRPVGYKVIFVPFAAGRPAGPPQDILTGFLDADGKAYGRPVGVAVDKAGALVVADDAGGVVWRVTPAVAPQPPVP